MKIQIYRSTQRLTRLIINQMLPGYEILCQPFTVLGHVISIRKGELMTAIIESVGEYYTLPLDYELSENNLSCFRKVPKGRSYNLHIRSEFVFKSIKSMDCRKNWWKTYCKMRDKALETHIYLI